MAPTQVAIAIFNSALAAAFTPLALVGLPLAMAGGSDSVPMLVLFIGFITGFPLALVTITVVGVPAANWLRRHNHTKPMNFALAGSVVGLIPAIFFAAWLGPLDTSSDYFEFPFWTRFLPSAACVVGGAIGSCVFRAMTLPSPDSRPY